MSSSEFLGGSPFCTGVGKVVARETPKGGDNSECRSEVLRATRGPGRLEGGAWRFFLDAVGTGRFFSFSGSFSNSV